MSEKKKTNPNANPNGANGTTKDPRQSIFWDIFIPKFEMGIENAYDAAIEAGYLHDTARNITLTDWYKDGIRELQSPLLLEKAEKRLRQYLGFEPVDQDGKIDYQLMNIQERVMKLVLKGIGKDTYSERQEHTGKDGQELTAIQVILK